jgi:predicted enzyme related to lactoylglutathione lyase
MREDGKIDFVEWPAGDLTATKAFYRAAFGWAFTDYGPSYAAFEGEGADGGFNADAAEAPAKPLVVLYAHDLEAMQAKVLGCGGKIVRPISAFPGGRRFHFTDPSGNELAIWSQT